MIVLKCIVGHHGACARSILVKLLTWIRTCCWQPSILNVSHRDELMYHFCTRTILPCILALKNGITYVDGWSSKWINVCHYIHYKRLCV